MCDATTKTIKLNRGEQFTANALRVAGFDQLRFHVRGLPGTPDVVVPAERLAVFHNGCFFHAHDGCSCARVPNTNSAFWTKKFQANRARDRRVRDELEARGWRTLTIWECASRHGDLMTWPLSSGI
jgi:DNA mismatch endonuclease (patch repair protein)